MRSKLPLEYTSYNTIAYLAFDGLVTAKRPTGQFGAIFEKDFRQRGGFFGIVAALRTEQRRPSGLTRLHLGRIGLERGRSIAQNGRSENGAKHSHGAAVTFTDRRPTKLAEEVVRL